MFMCLQTVRPNKPKCGSLEQRKGYCKAKQGEWVAYAQNPWTPWWFGGSWGEGCRMYGFPLIGRWWRNSVVLQKSCSQPELTIFHLGGDLSSCRRTQRYSYIYSLSGNQDAALKSCTIVSWLLLLCFCILWVSWWATVWTCTWEVRGGLKEASLLNFG